MAATSGNSEDGKTHPDLVERGSRRQDLFGTTIFLAARGLEPIFQYGILGRGWGTSLIQQLRGRVLPRGPGLVTHTALDRLGLSPYRSILAAMSTAASVKQIGYLLAISNEPCTPVLATTVGMLNFAFNSINSLLFACAQTSASVNGEHFPQTPLVVGTALFVLGIGIESIAEIQRAVWKRDPKNKGQIYDGGLFGLSRHVNYFGFTLWRTGYACAAGGWVWAAVNAAFFTHDFTNRAIPALQSYLEKRYGDKYVSYEKRVPYKFVPFVY